MLYTVCNVFFDFRRALGEKVHFLILGICFLKSGWGSNLFRFNYSNDNFLNMFFEQGKLTGERSFIIFCDAKFIVILLLRIY